MTPLSIVRYRRRGQWRWADVVPLPPLAGVDSPRDKQLRGAVEWDVIYQASPEDMTSLAPARLAEPTTSLSSIVGSGAARNEAVDQGAGRRGFWARVWAWLTTPSEALP